MKIKMLRNPANQLGCELTEGETGDVEKELGDRLVALGIAEPAGRRQSMQAVPRAPSISGAGDESVESKKERGE